MVKNNLFLPILVASFATPVIAGELATQVKTGALTVANKTVDLSRIALAAVTDNREAIVATVAANVALSQAGVLEPILTVNKKTNRTQVATIVSTPSALPVEPVNQAAAATKNGGSDQTASATTSDTQTTSSDENDASANATHRNSASSRVAASDNVSQSTTAVVKPNTVDVSANNPGLIANVKQFVANTHQRLSLLATFNIIESENFLVNFNPYSAVVSFVAGNSVVALGKNLVNRFKRN